MKRPKSAYSLIPLDDFKALLGIDDKVSSADLGKIPSSPCKNADMLFSLVHKHPDNYT